jgi:transcriptional regulator with XRE-family HTH domain
VNKPGPNSNLPVPRRLKAVRAVEGYETAKDFADALGISPNRYGNMEAGNSPLSYEVAQLIVKLVPGCSLDWLWNGEERGLTTAFRQSLPPGTGATNARTAAPSSRSARSSKGRSSNK